MTGFNTTNVVFVYRWNHKKNVHVAGLSIQVEVALRINVDVNLLCSAGNATVSISPLSSVSI